MAKKPVNFRLSEQADAALDWLAQSITYGGEPNRSAAVEEAVQHWQRLVAQAAADNASAFSREDWHLMAHACNGIGDEFGEGEPIARAWAPWIAQNLADMYEGRTVLLDSHREEQRAARALAKRVAKLDHVHGFALMDVLRWFWSRDVDAAGEWWRCTGR